MSHTPHELPEGSKRLKRRSLLKGLKTRARGKLKNGRNLQKIRVLHESVDQADAWLSLRFCPWGADAPQTPKRAFK